MGKLDFLFGEAMGCWAESKILERSPHALVFSFKSQHAVQDSGGSEGTSHRQPWC